MAEQNVNDLISNIPFLIADVHYSNIFVGIITLPKISHCFDFLRFLMKRMKRKTHKHKIHDKFNHARE